MKTSQQIQSQISDLQQILADAWAQTEVHPNSIDPAVNSNIFLSMAQTIYASGWVPPYKPFPRQKLTS